MQRREFGFEPTVDWKMQGDKKTSRSRTASDSKQMYITKRGIANLRFGECFEAHTPVWVLGTASVETV